jgi:sn-glycerol 3-phosphate transport system permease protein
MVERRPWLSALTHVVLIVGVLLVAFPLYITFVASTLTLEQVLQVPMRLLPGDQFWANYTQVLGAGSTRGSSAPVAPML